MVRYESDARQEEKLTAIFADGSKLPVRAGRDRSYPGLGSEAPDTSDCYVRAAEILQGRAVQVADLGCGNGAGSERLAKAGFAIVGVDRSGEAIAFARKSHPSIRFAEGAVEAGEDLPHDALVLIDVLGLTTDDAALLRALAKRVQPGTTLVGAVPAASISQHLVAPARRAYTAESLDAVLVRSGWAPPVSCGRVGGMLVFESHRATNDAAVEALVLAEALQGKEASDLVLQRLAKEARSSHDAAMIRELLLSCAELHCRRGETDAAETAATSANAIAPSAARPFVALARAARRRQAWDDAEALLDRALSIDEASAEAWTEMAAWFEHQGERASAMECLDFAAALEPADHAVAAEQARVLGAMGSGAAAMRVLDRVLAYGGGLTPALRSSIHWLGGARVPFGSSRLDSVEETIRQNTWAVAVPNRMAS